MISKEAASAGLVSIIHPTEIQQSAQDSESERKNNRIKVKNRRELLEKAYAIKPGNRATFELENWFITDDLDDEEEMAGIKNELKIR